MQDLMHPANWRAVAVAIIGTGLLINCPARAQNSPPDNQGQKFDLDAMLVQEAIQRGIAEIEMAKLAENKAEMESVHAFARRMLKDHGKLNERLIQVTRNLGIEVPTGPNENEATVIERLHTLQGAAFDQVYAVGVAQEHMRHYNLYARMAGTASAPDLRRLGEEAVPMLEEHQIAAQSLRVDVRPIAQGPLGAVPGQTVPPSEMTPQREQAPYSDQAEGAEP
jgi:putative membrane protein